MSKFELPDKVDISVRRLNVVVIHQIRGNIGMYVRKLRKIKTTSETSLCLIRIHIWKLRLGEMKEASVKFRTSQW